MTLVPNARYTAVKRGISAKFAMEAKKAAPYYPTTCMTVPSRGSDEGYAMLGAVNGMREWIGDRQFDQISAAEFTLKNKLWEGSLNVERHDVDDDRLGMLGDLIGDLAEESACHPDELLFEIQRGAEALPCWDGQFFFDTDHLWNNSTAQSNIVNITVADATNISPQEIKDGFEAALVRMAGFRRDNGKPWMRPTVKPPNSIRINTPLALWSNANRAFKQGIALESNAAGTTFAATNNVLLSQPQVDYIPYLGAAYGGSDVKMDVLYTGGRIKPFLFQMRQPLTTQTKGGDDIEFKTIKHLTEARYNIGFLAWFYAVRVVFAE